MATNDILGSDNLIAILKDTVSASAPSENDAVLLASPLDAMSMLGHAIMSAVGFRFVDVGEEATTTDEHLPNRPHEKELAEEHSEVPHSRDNDETMADASKHADAQPLPYEWRQSHTFRYTHPQSSMTFLLRVMKMASKIVFIGMAIENDKTVQFEVAAQDYTSSSFFPYKRSSAGDITPAYISAARVKDFATMFKIKIIQKLIPSLQKAGYQETLDTSETQQQQSSSAHRPQPPLYHEPLREPPRPRRDQRPPFFDDDDEGMIPRPGFTSPFSIGRDDLDPLGSAPFAGPPRIGGIGGGGFGPPRGMGPGGGMFVGPDHPMFAGRGGQPGGGFRPEGGDGRLPGGAVPPGARFDPIMPERGGVGGIGGRGRGRGQGHPSGEPDPDHEVPPGYNDMFM